MHSSSSSLFFVFYFIESHFTDIAAAQRKLEMDHQVRSSIAIDSNSHSFVFGINLFRSQEPEKNVRALKNSLRQPRQSQYNQLARQKPGKCSYLSCWYFFIFMLVQIISSGYMFYLTEKNIAV